MVGEVRVLRQERSMQVGAIGIAVDAALAPVFAIVAMASQHPPQRLGAAAEIGPAAVILEADERALAPGQGDIADAAGHLLALVDRPGVEDADAFQVWPLGGMIVFREE